MKDKEALEKLDHTLCLNSLLLRFNIDDEYHTDCKDAEEMVDCIETVQEALDQKEKQDKILSILKENAIKYVNEINKDVKSIQITITTCDDNFNKVEEWLDNEK